jgi:hypothetical protein
LAGQRLRFDMDGMADAARNRSDGDGEEGRVRWIAKEQSGVCSFAVVRHRRITDRINIAICAFLSFSNGT